MVEVTVASLLRQMKIMSAFVTASGMLVAMVVLPAGREEEKSLEREVVRLCRIRGLSRLPFFTRFAAMPLPMFPRPIQEICGDILGYIFEKIRK